MLIEKSTIQPRADGRHRPYKFTCNAAWVEINDGEKILFKRSDNDPLWYDPKHVKIVKALHALEDAILEAAEGPQ